MEKTLDFKTERILSKIRTILIFFTMKTFVRVAAATAASVLAVPASFAAIGFSNYFSASPDFTIERAFQYDNSHTYLVRVCNVGGTPVSAGTLKIAIGRSSYNKDERHYNGVTPPGGTCSNYEIPNVRRYGLLSERTYPISVSIAWQGQQSEFSRSNNSKVLQPSSRATPTGSWTSATSPSYESYSNWNGNNPYAGRTWYYPNTSNCYGYQYQNGTYRYQDGRVYSYDPYGCTYGNTVTPGTSGYYWPGYSTNPGYSGYVEMLPPPQYAYPNQPYYQYVDLSSYPNFTVTRIGKDGSYRNLLVTVCNWGADMSAYDNLSLEIQNLTRASRYRSTEYVRLLNGQCRDVSVPFTNFAFDYSGYYSFKVTADPENKLREQSETDNVLETNVWYER